MRARLLTGALIALPLVACSADPAEQPDAEPTAAASPAAADPLATPGPLPPQVADFPVLESRDCRQVAQFYLDAVADRDYARAALVWNDPVIDASRLEALFAGYQRPEITLADVMEEGAAGSLYCTITGALIDAADSARPPREGMLELRRVNDVPGATAEQLRWTIRRSTFVEPMERSGRGDPA